MYYSSGRNKKTVCGAARAIKEADHGLQLLVIDNRVS